MLLNCLLRKATLVVSGVALGGAACAQVVSGVHTDARPSVRITQQIDGAKTAVLAGTHPAIVERAAIGARLRPATQLPHMRLVLNASDDQAVAIQTLLSQQQDKTSANYHQWLTPETYAVHFGVAASDLAQITAWLAQQGFTVDSVAKGGRIVTFSGTAGQVEAAFHTEMHTLTVNGEAHVSNTTDLQVPQALAGVVRGVAALNDFYPRASAVNPRKVQFSSANPGGAVAPLTAGSANTAPQYTSTSSGSHYVTPGDAATIFNSAPLVKAGVDGTGQTIAVLGQTDIALADVQQFRSMFGLKKNDPTFTTIGEDPGTTGDDIEAYLDVEWAGGMAPGASVSFINGGSDYFTNSGIANAGMYAVDNNIGDIITLSYGGCESSNGASGTAFWNTLWEQAAAQGQTVFVSSGDSDATGCFASSAAAGTSYGVNALGSSAYNVAVGGSMFVDYGPNLYWTTGSAGPTAAGYNFATATSYIPEAVWNEGQLSTTYLNSASTGLVQGSGIVGGGGGLSIYTPRPAWQVGSGISPTADATCSSGTCIATNTTSYTVHRMVPDLVSIAASGHDATAFCAEGVCYDSSTGYQIGAVGGTSVATPVMASVQALINQKNGGRQGNANFYYYKLANQDYAAGNCKAVNGTAAAPAVTLPAATCNFHDVVAGDDRAPQSSTDTTGLGFYAGTGYDAASGLGSMNIANVAANWSKVNFNATSTAFTLSPTTLTTHGAAQSFSVAVTSGSGTPTGDFSIIAQTATPGTTLRYTLSNGTYSGSLAGLPGGTYNVYANYEGDGTFAPSQSAPIQVQIGTEQSGVAMQFSYFFPGSYNTGSSSVPYGYLVDVLGQVQGASLTGTPSGKLTFAVTQNGVQLPSLTNQLDSQATAALVAGAGYTAIDLSPNYPVLAPGNYTVTASYPGDASFQPSTGSVSFAVTQYTPTGTLTTSATYINPSAAITLNLALKRIGLNQVLAAYPTGTVTFTDTTSGVTLGQAQVNAAGIATVTTTGIAATGANTITATYAGDANYLGISKSVTVTVGSQTPTTTVVSVTGSYIVLAAVPITATVSPAATGTVSFYDSGVLLGQATSNASGVATLNASTLIAGPHTLSATFGGTSTYAASTGSTSVTIGQNGTNVVLNAPAYSTVGQTVSLEGRIQRTTTVSSAGTVLLTGTVTFFDGSTAVGSATPVYQVGGYNYYDATFSTAALARGIHTLTASYSGDANFLAATSSAVTLTVTPNNVWVADGGGSISGLSTTGSQITNTSGGGKGLAIDGSGNLWSLNQNQSSVAEFSSLGAVINSGYTGAGISGPGALAIDGAGSVWIVNSNATVSALSPAGAAISPAGGYPTKTPATSTTPTALVIDASGNLWVTDTSDNSLTEIVGAAAPVSTPMTTAVTNNSLATRP